MVPCYLRDSLREIELSCRIAVPILADILGRGSIFEAQTSYSSRKALPIIGRVTPPRVELSYESILSVLYIRRNVESPCTVCRKVPFYNLNLDLDFSLSSSLCFSLSLSLSRLSIFRNGFKKSKSVREDEYKKTASTRASCFLCSHHRVVTVCLEISGVNRSTIFTIYLFLDLEKRGKRRN